MRRRIATILALALSTLLVAGMAVAQEADADAEANGTVLHGSGVLYAKGTGTVILNMGGELRMGARGDVTITDYAGDATIVIDDGPDRSLSEAADGGTTIVLEDFTGAIFVRGRHFRVRVDGSTEFVARGHGTAFLKGDGVWRTRHNRGTWSQNGLRLSVA